MSKGSLLVGGGEWSGWRAIQQNAFLHEGPKFFDPTVAPAWMTIGSSTLKNGVTRVGWPRKTFGDRPGHAVRCKLAHAGMLRQRTMPRVARRTCDRVPDDRDPVAAWLPLPGIVGAAKKHHHRATHGGREMRRARVGAGKQVGRIKQSGQFQDVQPTGAVDHTVRLPLFENVLGNPAIFGASHEHDLHLLVK